jgi:pimeloyl-ACP methyl ester carboxylesterase
MEGHVTFHRKDLYFQSRGTRCAAWLYLPQQGPKPPVVVMAHGLGAERAFGLGPFAEHFALKGMAVFVFDYRNFGDSQGEPRNLVSPRRHLQDWQAAIAHVGSLAEVDRGRMALWGSSFSGGHVLVTAARHPEIAALVVQVPFVDGIDSIRKLGLRYALRAALEGARDLLHMAAFRGRHRVPVVSDPDRFGVLNTPECKPGYLALVPEATRWENACPAAFLLTVALYRPTSYAGRVRCPALIMPARKDTLISLEAVRKTASRMRDARLVALPIGHFEIYADGPFEQAVEIQADFLAEHFRMKAS